MKYKIVTSKISKEATLNNLSRNLNLQSEIYALSDGEIYLGAISNKTLALFAVEFAEYALQNYEKERIPEAEICISLMRKWLRDDTSVSKEELKAAADAAYATTYGYGDAYAVYAAFYAATFPVYSINPADATSYSANAATDAAAYAAGKSKEEEYQRQGNFIIDFLKSGNHLFLA